MASLTEKYLFHADQSGKAQQIPQLSGPSKQGSAFRITSRAMHASVHASPIISTPECLPTKGATYLHVLPKTILHLKTMAHGHLHVVL